MIKNWKFAAITPNGIFTGELIGEMEKCETVEEAMQEVSRVVMKQLSVDKHISHIIGCIVSDSQLYIHAPGTTRLTLNEETDITL